MVALGVLPARGVQAVSVVADMGRYGRDWFVVRGEIHGAGYYVPPRLAATADDGECWCPTCRHDGDGVVYFVEAVGTGLTKIGHTVNNLDRRIANMQGQSPAELVVRDVVYEATRNLERRLHEALIDYRHHREWFDLPLTANRIIGPVVSQYRRDQRDRSVDWDGGR